MLAANQTYCTCVGGVENACVCIRAVDTWKKKKCELSASFYGLRTKKYKHKKNVWCFGCITNSAGVAQKEKKKKEKNESKKNCSW